MEDNKDKSRDEIYSERVRAGKRTYFFDVRETKASDYYLTITESKKFTNDDGSYYYKKHKIYLYKEDFQNFKDHLNEMVDYIIKERGEEIISLNKEEKSNTEVSTKEKKEEPTTDFTEVNFDDLGKEEE